MNPNEPQPNVYHALAGMVVLSFLAASAAAWIGFFRNRARARLRPCRVGDESTAQYGMPESRLGPALATASSMPRWRASAVFGAFLLYSLLQLGALAIFSAGVLSVSQDRASAKLVRSSPETQVIYGTLVNLALVLTLPPLIRLTSGITSGDLGLRLNARAFLDARLGFRAFLLITPIVYLIAAAATRIWPAREHAVEQVIQSQGAAPSAGLAIVSAVIAAPLAEELLIRGVMLGWLVTVFQYLSARGPGGDVPPELTETGRERNLKAFWLANALVSLAFAWLHVDAWPAPIPLFVLSMALGWTVQRTGRLSAAIALHAAFNALSTVLFLLQAQAAAVGVR